GIPVISCERDRIRIEIETTRPFGGKVFVKGEYANRQCMRSYVDGIPSSPHGYTLASSPFHVVEHGNTTQENNRTSPTSPEYDNMGLKNRETTAKVGDTRLDNVHSKWPEHSAVNSTTEESIGNKNTTPDRDSSGSVWSGYGGVSATKGKSHQYLGAFGGSHKENAHPPLKIYSKPKSHDANNLPNLQHSGSQGLISLNCPEKCEPCVCSKEEQPQERKRRTTNHVELSVPLGACNAKRDRKLSPPTLSVSFVAVISFHESFITKLDRAYHIQCAYMEINKTLSAQMNIGQEETSNVNGTAMPPVCEYHISSSDGRPIQNVHVGERVKHVWNCTTTVPKLYSMLVHSCFIEDGAGQRYEVIDKYGCSLDPYILNTPHYDQDKPTASVDAFMMKFPDRSSVDFQCSIKVCSKLDQDCSAIVPFDCSSPEMSLRSRRAASTEDDSMTIHANSLVVLDMDMAQELPQHLAYSQTSWIPMEFCLSVAGFGILVSASTFLTTITIGI
ncbi:hypothetical protein Angca_005070, partial [Angiostrongylus cantonensis]